MISVLNSHPVTYLKNEISKTNIKEYSKKMKKKEVVDLMMKYSSKFSHVTVKEKKAKKELPPKAPQESESMFKVSSQYINKRCGLHKKSDQKQNPNNTDTELGIINSKNKFTKCSDHVHLSDDEYNSVIEQIVTEFTNAKFKSTVDKFYSTDDIINKYDKLKNKQFEEGQTSMSSQSTASSNTIIYKFQKHGIFNVKDHNGDNPFSDNWKQTRIERSFKSLDKPNATVNSYFSEFLKTFKYTKVTVYSPIITKLILEKLGCKRVFDPCIGWGGRMVGSVCLSNSDVKYSYVGCEPCKKTFNSLEDISKFVCKNDPNVNSDQIEIYNNPVEDLLHTEKFSNYTFDCCLTSPPYYDLEIYSDEKTQSINNYKTYRDWLTKFIEPIIKYIETHVTKYSCWSVKKFKTKETYDLVEDIHKLHTKYGFEYHSKYFIKGSDETYIFKKK